MIIIEILSKTEYINSHYLTMAFLILVALFLISGFVSIIVVSIAEKDFDINAFLGCVCTLAFASILIVAIIGGIEQGHNITYKATITDFNEVYESGYWVTGKEGSLYILEKRDE